MEDDEIYEDHGLQPLEVSEENDEFNDDTFGDDAGGLQEDFDYSKNTMTITKSMPLPQSTSTLSQSTPRHVSYEASTSSQIRTAQEPPMSHMDPSIISMRSSSYAAVEPVALTRSPNAGAALLALLKKEPHASMASTLLPLSLPLPPNLPNPSNNSTAFNLPAAPQPPIDKYAGFMTQNEISFIHRIQYSQLVTDSPYMDDFYYQSYAKYRNRKKNQTASGFRDPLYLPLPHIPNRYMNKNPKPTDLVVQGALGKIALNSIRRPRQSLVVESMQAPRLHSSSLHLNDNKKSKVEILNMIELVHSAAIAIEDAFSDRDANDFRTLAEREAIARPHREFLYRELGIVDGHIEAFVQHPLVDLTRLPKGMKCVGRVIPILDETHKQYLFDALLSSLEYMEVVSGSLSGKVSQEELFISSILSPLVSYVAEADWSQLLTWVELFLAKKYFAELTLKKVGHVALCVLLSRAEMLKPGTEPGSSQPSHWKGLIHRVFERLTGLFHGLFTSTSDAMTSLSLSDDARKCGSPEEDYYAWQFLALLAMSLESGPCHEMIAELRSDILHCANSSHPVAVSNVNLLLQVIGLDASQLRTSS